jgi:uncharacterized FlaG/YvyC family protein
MDIKKINKVNKSSQPEKYNPKHQQPVNSQTSSNNQNSFKHKSNMPDNNELEKMLEKTLNDYNKMFDKNNKDLYIFYENIDVGFLIKIADIHTSEIKFQHEICVDCINSVDTMLKIINDFVNDKGLLIDYNA